MDRTQQTLLEALRTGAAASGELRLYRGGKLPGLFTSRMSLCAEAAAQAVREGLIELTRSETKGKTVTEWVRVTPKGMQFILDHDSPVCAMEELRDLLKVNGEGLPAWVEDLRRRFDAVGQRFLEEVATLKQRMDLVSARVEEALKRADKYGPAPAAGAAGSIPWAHAAVEYLVRRHAGGLGEQCPLPELFGHLRGKDGELTIRDFHLGIRRLHDRGAVRLLPHESDSGPPEPEYALLDGATVYWYAAR